MGMTNNTDYEQYAKQAEETEQKTAKEETPKVAIEGEIKGAENAE